MAGKKHPRCNPCNVILKRASIHTTRHGKRKQIPIGWYCEVCKTYYKPEIELMQGINRLFRWRDDYSQWYESRIVRAISRRLVSIEYRRRNPK